MKDQPNLQIAVFHCINVFGEGEALLKSHAGPHTVTFYKLPCSSLVKDVYLLRAFESGADGVMAVVCPAGVCRYVEGNARAQKRLQRVQATLDEIGLGGRRLALFHLPPKDAGAFDQALMVFQEQLAALGPSPAK